MITIAELQRVLELALRNRPFGHVPGAEAAFRELTALLADHPDLPVDVFCLRVREGLRKKPRKAAAAKPAKAAAASALNEPAIARYLGELRQTRTDTRQFERVVERMKKDKQVKLGEVREIARRFIGGSQSYKTKGDAVKAVLQRQMTDVRAEGKAEHIADIF